VLDGFRDEEGRAFIDELLASPDDTTTFDTTTTNHSVIWAETPWPGLRTKVVGRTKGGEALLQIDCGQGDTLVLPPAEVSIAGNPSVLGVTPETMYGWKTDGLFEFGHGSWRAKDLYDLWLIDRHVALDHEALVASVRAAFEHQSMALSVADRFLFTELWGASRGSRRRWEAFGRRTGLLATMPDIGDAIRAIRRRLLPVFAALGHTHSSDATDRALRDHDESPEQKAGDDHQADE
jgi:hypothetical protein